MELSNCVYDITKQIKKTEIYFDEKVTELNQLKEQKENIYTQQTNEINLINLDVITVFL